MKDQNTPTGWNDKINSILEQWNELSEKEQSELLATLQQNKKGMNDKIEKDKLPEVLDIPEELKDYRKAWEQRIYFDDDMKKEMIDIINKIPVKVEIDDDGSRIIEFKLWNKKYKILDPKLKNHSDDKYFDSEVDYKITRRDERVTFWWMKWDDIEWWENKKLKKYIKEKKREWLHIAKRKEIKELLEDIWKIAGTNFESYEIAMLMYLTWMDWIYRIDDEYAYGHGHSSEKWSYLKCFCFEQRLSKQYVKDDSSANLCLISIK